MICKKCGSVMADDDIFCAVCGTENPQKTNGNNQPFWQQQTVQMPAPPQPKPQPKPQHQQQHQPQRQPYTPHQPQRQPYAPQQPQRQPYAQPQPGSYNGVPGANNNGNNTNRIILIIAIVTVVIIVGIVIAFAVINSNDKQSTTRYNSMTTVPTTQEEATKSEKKKEKTTAATGLMDKADGKLRSIINSSASHDIELSVINVNTGEINTYGGSSTDTASALVLYPVLYFYAQQIDNGYIHPNDTLVVKNATNGRGTLSSSSNGERYTIEKLFNLAFEYSDNTAINTLLSNYYLSDFEKVCREGGYNSVRVEKYVGIDSFKGANNTISSSDLAEMIREMIRNGGFANDMMNAYGVIRSQSVMGMGTQMHNPIGNLNGYTDYVYDEVIRFKDSSGDYVAVLISESSNWKQGRSTAEEVGGCLEKCLD